MIEKGVFPLQLNRILDYYKALADINRLRIVLLLAVGPLSGQEIAHKLGLSPATVTHHMNQLRNAALVKGVRDKNTINFHLVDGAILERAEELLRRVETVRFNNMPERQKVIKNFFDAEGRLKSIPTQRKKRMFVFEHMLAELEPGRSYTEQEINEFIERFHDDYCTIRREFIINHYMYREDNIYTLNPQELWAPIES